MDDNQRRAQAGFLSHYDDDNDNPPPPAAGNGGAGNGGAGNGGAGNGGAGNRGGAPAWTYRSLLKAILSTVLVISLAYYLHPTITDLSVCSRSQPSDCRWIPTPTSSTKTLPLPYQVDEPIHKIVLNQINESEPEKLINNLILQRSLVIIYLNETVSTVQSFPQYLIYTKLKDNISYIALIDYIHIFQQRLDAVVEAINILDTLYASMKSGYDEFAFSSAEALRKSQWSPMHRALIRNQMEWSRWLKDLDKWWGVRFRQKLRKDEEARLGVTALNRESQRVQQIWAVFRELRRIAGVLETSVIQWKSESVYDKLHNDGIGQERLRVWFRQNIYQNPQLGKLWDELVSSVNKEEEGLLVKFTTEWCGS